MIQPIHILEISLNSGDLDEGDFESPTVQRSYENRNVDMVYMVRNNVWSSSIVMLIY